MLLDIFNLINICQRWGPLYDTLTFDQKSDLPFADAIAHSYLSELASDAALAPSLESLLARAESDMGVEGIADQEVDEYVKLDPYQVVAAYGASSPFLDSENK